MDYVVFDLEWNQSNTRSEPKVENFPFEIIEIGAVRLTEDGVLDGEFNELIKNVEESAAAEGEAAPEGEEKAEEEKAEEKPAE